MRILYERISSEENDYTHTNQTANNACNKGYG